jgi:uncharacterized coiled-coil protein SlyX
MDNAFDKAYAKYLNSLAKLDQTDNIAEKNLLFRQLAEQLNELEDRLKNRGVESEREETDRETPEPAYWI